MRSLSIAILFFSAVLFLGGNPLNGSEQPTAPQEDSVNRQENICGPYCLTAILRFFDINANLKDLIQVQELEHGTNMAQLGSFAKAYGLETLGANISSDILCSVRYPAILHVNGNHFIAYLPNRTDQNFIVIDPPNSYDLKEPEELLARWDWQGSCLLISDKKIDIPVIRLARQRRYGFYGVATVMGLAIIVIVLKGGRKGMVGKKAAVALPTMIGLISIIILTIAANAAEGREKDAKAQEPRLSIDNPIYDAGVIFDDQDSIAQTFKITNKGTADLKIEKIKTDCSCTVVKQYDKLLAPQTSTNITIMFNVKKRFGKLTERKSVIYSNDSRNPRVVVVIRAERRREFTLKPPALQGIIELGKGKVFFVKVTSGSEDRKLVLKEAKCSPYLDILQVVEFGDQKKGNYLLKVQLTPKVPTGIFEGSISIPCVGASRKTLKIPVYVEVIGPIRSSLSKVNFGLIAKTSKNLKKEISLRSDMKFGLVDVAVDRSWLSISDKNEDNTKASFVINLDSSSAPKGKLEGVVTVKTNLPEMEYLKILVTAFK